MKNKPDFEGLIKILKEKDNNRLAPRLKLFVIVTACIIGVGLGIGMASLGYSLFSSSDIESGRLLRLDEFQSRLEPGGSIWHSKADG